YGDVGDDTLHGDDDNDTLDGAVGNDALSGGAGNDFVYGGGNIDILSCGRGDDSIDGGAGNHSVDYSYDTDGVTVTFNTTVTGNAGAGDVDTITTVEVFYGTDAADRMIDGNGAATISAFGGQGDDTASPDPTGNDVFYG